MLVIGHRGAAGYKIENTISSIKKAIELKVDYFEVDVQETKDGEIIVFHDFELDRLTNSKGKISELNYSDIKKVVVKNEEHIPTLKEVLKLIKNENVNIFIEIKTQNIEKKVIEIALKYLTKNRFILGSFYHKVVKNIKKIDNEIETLSLLEGYPVDISSIIKDSKCDYLGLGYGFIDKEFVSEIHKNSCKVFVWTVNRIEDIKNMYNCNVDGIISNYPDRVLL